MGAPVPPSSEDRRATVARRAERARAFIYGTIATLIALAGFESIGGRPIAAGAIVAVSAIATWWAHAYSTVLAERITTEVRITVREVRRALQEAWPIVTAAVPATLLCIGANAELWTLQAAILVANLAGIAVMGIAGLIAAHSADVGRLATLGWVGITAGIGAVIVLVEVAVHH